jgi:hypothetical protein
MNTLTTRAEEIMTDFQLKSIIKMVLSIARKSGDLKAVITELEKLLPPNERDDIYKQDDN